MPKGNDLGQVLRAQPVELDGQRCPRVWQIKDPDPDQPQLLQFLPAAMDPLQKWKAEREDVLKNPRLQRPTPEPPLPRQ
jgi:hypothetical protein